jgi:hypothetical protein
MFPGVDASVMFPSRSSHQHGPPLLGRVLVPAVPRRLRSYSALRLPAPHRTALRFPLRGPTFTARTCSWPGCAYPGRRAPVGIDLRVPGHRLRFMKERQGLPDDWPTLLDTCRSRTLRRLRRPLVPHTGGGAAAFRHNETLGTGMLVFSELHSHGLHLRVPTHRRHGYPRRRKARYRPAGLRFGRAGFAPAGWVIRISRGSEKPPSQRTRLHRSLPSSHLTVRHFLQRHKFAQNNPVRQHQRFF